MFSRLKTLVAALAVLALAATPRAQTVRVESEDFVPPTGNATLGSGPNATNVVGVDALRAISPPAAPKEIGYFDAWDWLEYNVNIPTDGTYSITIRYSSNPASTITSIPVVVTSYTTGQQIFSNDIVPTGSWDTMNVYTLQNTIALKAGVNRIRLAIRPDAISGPSMNMDYIEFARVDNLPAFEAISGTVTTSIGGTATPLEGALVSVGADYTAAQYLTRTDASGKYTLYVPAGQQSVTAFANGFARATASVPAPGTHDFSLTWNGIIEAELLDATRTGPQFGNGVQPEYNTTLPSKGQISYLDIAKFADWKHVVVPTAGVYDLSIHYANDSASNGRLRWQANGGTTTTMTYVPSGGGTSYVDSSKVLVELKQGLNTLHMVDPDSAGTAYANIDYLTLAPTAQPYGRLTVTVKTASGGLPIAFAAVTLTGTGTGAVVSGGTDATGTFTAPLVPDTYNITVSKGANSVTDTATIAANDNITRNYTLNITSLGVEAEDFVASGPELPGPAVTVTTLGGASGGKVIEDFTGKGNTDAGLCNFKWAEWAFTVPAGQAGLYQVTVHYATDVPSGENILNFWTSGAQLHTFGTPNTTGPTDYADYTYDSTVPLLEGENRFRMTMVTGALNIDYFTFQRIDALPKIITYTGTVKGSDGTGSAPIAGAYVYVPGFDLGVPEAQFLTVTDATGKYTLNTTANSGSTAYYTIAAQANGYIPASVDFVQGPATKDFTLNINNPDAATPPALRTDFNTYDSVTQFLTAEGTGQLCTAYQELNFVQPGPDTWAEFRVSVPRAGAYTIAANEGSNWPPTDQPGHLVVTVNGAAQTVTFPKTGDYATHVTVPLVTNVNLNAGANTLRVAFPDAAANITYFDFIRTGNAVQLPSTDINSSGHTDIVDAVLYARRLAGLDAGPTEDLTGDGSKNAQDVARILRVASGLGS